MSDSQALVIRGSEVTYLIGGRPFWKSLTLMTTGPLGKASVWGCYSPYLKAAAWYDVATLVTRKAIRCRTIPARMLRRNSCLRNLTLLAVLAA